MKLVTLGAFGFGEKEFFDALAQAGVDTFCDIRWRRGVRGAEYAFANSQRLRRSLDTLGIRYLHFRELAPPPALRQCQAEADKELGVAKRKRTTLGEAFIKGYQERILAGFDSRRFIEGLGPATQVAALFCVEREPAACHRSLLAERIAHDLNLEVVHLSPPPPT
jgi:uncharacterized protein (DUF488 family)